MKEKRDKNRKFEAGISLIIVATLLISGISMVSGADFVKNSSPSLSNTGSENMNPLSKPLVPHPIYGTATWEGGGNADGASVVVTSSLGSLSTTVSSGAWQVDCGDPGSNWPAATSFTVTITGSGAHDGWSGSGSGSVSGYANNVGNVAVNNDAPSTPSTPSGSTTLTVGVSTSYSTSATDSGEQVQYRFDWYANGAHDYSSWTALVASGTPASMSHSWGSAGTYVVKAQARDQYGKTSGWSGGGLTVVVSAPNTAPNTPNNPSLANGSTNVGVITDIGWTGGDPDVGDSVMYDVYFGSSSTPLKVSGNQSGTTYDTGTMGYNTVYYWRIIAWDNHGAKTIGPLWHFTTAQKQNNPPVYGTPSPGNGSTGNPLSLSWSIPINDPEGNVISWTIQCSNGQTSSGTGAANGTKSLSLSGLAYSTTYKVWVNATDPTGSGLYTRKWYTFTTKGSTPPVFGTSSPENGSLGNLLSLSWSIPINDPEGDSFNWVIQCSNGQSANANGASNGTKSIVLSSLVYSITYKVWVNATDPTGSRLYTRRWYTFTTRTNLPPVFGTPSPANSSTNNLLSITWSIPINDPEGNTFTCTIQCNNGQTSTATGATNGTKSLALSGLVYSTTYKVWVNATDPTGSGLYTRKWYTFTTQQQPNVPPNKPNKPSGTASGKTKTMYTYATSTTDPNGDQVYYLWDWGDGTQSNWLGPYNSGVTINTTHKWTVKGSYSIKVKATDTFGAESPWSDPLPIKMPTSQNAVVKFIDLILSILRGEHRGENLLQLFRTL